jgi:hypothetical protein
MSNIKVRIGAQTATRVLSTGSVPTLFTKLFDVDASVLENGAIAVYNASTQKFVTQRTLNLDSLVVENIKINGDVTITEIDGGTY